MSSLRQGKITSDNSKTVPVSSFVVIDLLYHISSFAKVLVAADPLEIIGTENEKAAFVELKSVFLTMMNSVRSESINVQPFLDKLSAWTNIDYSKVEQTDILCVWDDIVKLVMVVIPPLREVFLGQVASAQEVPGWLNLMSRCFHAHFTESSMSLEDVYRTSLQLAASVPPDVHPDSMSAVDRLRSANAMVLRRAPEILVVSVESSHLSSRFLSQLVPTGMGTLGASKTPSAIRFPISFDLTAICVSAGGGAQAQQEGARIYDLTAVVALEGVNLDTLQAYFRLEGDENVEYWYRGAGFTPEEVPKSRVIEGNFYGGTGDKRVHPRLLVYTRRDLPQVLDRTVQLVSKAGQMRALGDVAFALAMTTENYSEARRCYEEAISLDESLRHTLQENLNSLEKIERTQKARVLEEQADLSLANRRFREASELYSKAMMSAVVGSGVYLRVREKLESVTKIIGLETACQFGEKGEEALRAGSLGTAKDLFAQAFKLNPEYLHLHSMLVAIEKTVQMQSASQKIAEAQQATKAYRYKLANQLYRDAIALVPEKQISLQATLDNLVPLMQGEDALNKQRAGLAALEDKRYTTAIALFTEAMSLLPQPNAPSAEKAAFLSDRAQAHYELKDYTSAIADCTDALTMKADLAIAHFRLGASQFALELYDEAAASYDRALKNDPSLSEAIKIKVRQVNTAKEIQQRKEREAERARQKEEERKMIEEKRAREEQQRKEKAEKLAQEQLEKAERKRLKEEEQRLKLQRENELKAAKEREKEAEKERLRIERAEREAQKALERERKQQEKERERERARLEKEQNALREQLLQEEERRRQKEFAEELERAAIRQREAEKEKEAERERARVERERIIAERERARQEKEAQKKATTSVSDKGAAKAPRSSDDVSSNGKSGKTGGSVPAGSSSAGTYSEGPNGARWSTVAVLAPRTTASSVEEEALRSLSWSSSRQATDASKPFQVPPPAAAPPPDSLKDFPSLGNTVPSSSSKAASTTSTDPNTPTTTPSTASPAAVWGDSSSRRSSSVERKRSNKGMVSSSSSGDIFAAAAEASGMLMDHAGSFKPSAQALLLAEQKARSVASEQKMLLMRQKSPELASGSSSTDDLLSNPFASGLRLDSSLGSSALGMSSAPSSSTSSAPSSSSGLYGGPFNLGFGGSVEPFGAPRANNTTVKPTKNGSELELGSSFNEFSVLGALGGLDFEDSLMKPMGGLSGGASMLSGTSGLGGLTGSSSGTTRASSRILDAASAAAAAGDRSSSPVPVTAPSSSSSSSGSSILGGLSGSSGGLGGLGGLGALGPDLGINDISPSVPSSSSIGRPNSTGLSINDGVALSSAGLGGATGLAMNRSLGGSSLLGSPLDPLSMPQAQRSQSLGLGLGLGGLGNGNTGAGIDPLLDPSGGSGAPSAMFPFRSSSAPLAGLGSSFLTASDAFQPPPPQQQQPQFSSRSDILGSPVLGLGLGVGVGLGVGLGSASSGAFSSSSDGLGGVSPAVGGSTGSGGELDYFSSNGLGMRQATSLLGGTGSSLLGASGQPSMSGLLGSSSLQSSLSSSSAMSGNGGRGAHQYNPLAPPPQQQRELLNGYPSHPNQPQQSFLQPAVPASSSSMGSQQRMGIDGDLVPDHLFPSVAWLRHYGMCMYRWAGDANEWLDFAMNIPPEIIPGLIGNDGSKIAELQAASGCKIWLDREVLRGTETFFLVLHRGANGQPFNANMNLALELVSNRMKQLLQMGIASPRPPSLPPAPPSNSAHSAPPAGPWAAAAANGLGGGMPTSSTSSSGGGMGLFSSEDDNNFDFFDFNADNDGSTGLDVADWASSGMRRPSTRRPEPLKVAPMTGGYVQRALEIPRDAVGIIIGQGGKKIKDLCSASGAKIQFRVNKTAEREGRPGLLELQGTAENVDQGMQLIWDLLHVVGKEYTEVPVTRK